MGMIDMLAFLSTNLQRELFRAEDDVDAKRHFVEGHLNEVDKSFDRIPEFQPGLDWFNVAEALTIKSLEGKIVVLDFFTYCCINCMHILPDLAQLEERYPPSQGVVIIGVHSAKFDNEKESANIMAAIQRYNISHPVVNDKDSKLWDLLDVQCWPTLLILGPRGNPIFVIMGEGHLDTLSMYISGALDFYTAKGQIKLDSLPLKPANNVTSSNLYFPGKIVCSKYETTEAGDELYAISDSGHHRILVMTPKGEVLYKIGGNSSGFQDGDFQTARFNSPQGLAFLSDSIIFVADTENHAVRRIDLKLGTVETVAGTGQQGSDKFGGKIGQQQEINSPWDVAVFNTKDMDMSFHVDEAAVPEKYVVLIAMAGTHQIWALFLEDTIWWKYKKYPSGTVVNIAGSGAEENRNNSYPQNAAFAQPSGLALNREAKEVYVADSESSTVRKLSLTDGKITGIVGGDRNPLNLFAFGDADGKQTLAKLQHCLGVTYSKARKSAFVADTYNGKVKRIDLEDSAVSTWTITDKSNKPYHLSEPAGLCLNPSGDTMYVCDTNAHQIELVNMKTMKTATLQLKFNSPVKEFDYGKILKFDKLKINSKGGKIRLAINCAFEAGVKLTEGAPQKFVCKAPETWKIAPDSGDYKVKKNVDLDIAVPKKGTCFQFFNFLVNFKLNLCSGDVCFFRNFTLDFPVVYANDGLDVIEEVTVKVGQDVKI